MSPISDAVCDAVAFDPGPSSCYLRRFSYAGKEGEEETVSMRHKERTKVIIIDWPIQWRERERGREKERRRDVMWSVALRLHHG